VILETLDTVANRDSLVLRERRELRDNPGPLEVLESRESKGHQVLLDRWAHREAKEQPVRPAHSVPLEPWDNPELLGLREARDLLGHLDLRETQDELDQQDHVVRLEIVVQLEELARQDPLGHLVRLGIRAHPVNRAIQETPG
jgi:hypothetical protein